MGKAPRLSDIRLSNYRSLEEDLVDINKDTNKMDMFAGELKQLDNAIGHNGFVEMLYKAKVLEDELYGTERQRTIDELVGESGLSVHQLEYAGISDTKKLATFTDRARASYQQISLDERRKMSLILNINFVLIKYHLMKILLLSISTTQLHPLTQNNKNSTTITNVEMNDTTDHVG